VLDVKAKGSLTITVTCSGLEVQLFISVTLTVYDPAVKLLIIDVF